MSRAKPPSNIEFEFEDFCDNCVNMELKCDGTALFDGNKVTEKRHWVTCENLDRCRYLYKRFLASNGLTRG